MMLDLDKVALFKAIREKERIRALSSSKYK